MLLHEVTCFTLGKGEPKDIFKYGVQFLFPGAIFLLHYF